MFDGQPTGFSQGGETLDPVDNIKETPGHAIVAYLLPEICVRTFKNGPRNKKPMVVTPLLMNEPRRRR